MTAKIDKDRKDLKSMIIVFKTHQALTEYIKNDISKTGFDLNEFGVFEVIYHKQNPTVQEIKDKVLVANSSLTYILDKLEKKDLIRRDKCQNDRRVTYVSLTENGIKKAMNTFPNHYENLKTIFSVLTSEEKETLNSLLKKIGYNAKESLLWNIHTLTKLVIKH